MRDGFAYYFALMLLRRLPMLLLCFGAIIFAFLKWKLHPRASLMTVIALAIHVIDMFVYSIVLYYLIDFIIRPMRLSMKAVQWAYFFVYVGEDFVFALVIILLVAAAFTQRKVAAAGSNA